MSDRIYFIHKFVTNMYVSNVLQNIIIETAKTAHTVSLHDASHKDESGTKPYLK